MDGSFIHAKEKPEQACHLVLSFETNNYEMNKNAMIKLTNYGKSTLGINSWSRLGLVTTPSPVLPLDKTSLKFLTQAVVDLLVKWLNEKEPKTKEGEISPLGRDIMGSVKDDQTFFSLVLAAEHLHLDSLVRLCRKYLVFLLENTDSNSRLNELRERMGIQSDFSEEESHYFEDFLSSGKRSEGKGVDQEADLSLSFIQSDLPSPQKNALLEKQDKAELEFLRSVTPRREMQPDDGVENCSLCKTKFSLTVRKHHCRVCGKLVCGECSPQAMQLPKDETLPTVNVSVVSQLVSWTINGFDSTLHRVCKLCAEELNKPNFSEAFAILALPLAALKKSWTVCKSWRRSCISCFASMHKAHYLLPTQQLTQRQKNFIWNNREYWAGHSRWLVQLMKAVDWNDPACCSQALQILKRQNRKCKCSEVLCSRLCAPSLGVDCALDLLSSSVPDTAVREFAVESLKASNPEKLLPFVPLLVHNLRYEPVIFPLSKSPLASFLIKQATDDSLFCSNLYWALYVSSESKKFNKRYMSMIQELIARLHTSDRLTKTMMFMELLENMPEDIHSNIERKKEFMKHLNDTFCNIDSPLHIPMDIEQKIVRFDEQIEVKNSATAPIVLSCSCIATTRDSANEWTEEIKDKYRVMYKKDDVRKDQVVLDVIRLMDMILAKEGHSPTHLLTYKVLPTSSSNGLLQIVPTAKTLFDIGDKLSDLQNFIFNNTGSRTIDDVKTVLARSAAAYYVITYLLGVGDRHLGNMMVTADGVFFHIDYGFILGEDPNPMMPFARITRQTIEALGGEDSKHFRMYQERCDAIYLCLRRYASLFMKLLLLLPNADPPIQGFQLTAVDLERELIGRFLPAHTDEEALETFHLRMAASCDTVSLKSRDLMHGISQKKPIQTTVNVVSGAISSWATQLTTIWWPDPEAEAKAQQ